MNYEDHGPQGRRGSAPRSLKERQSGLLVPPGCVTEGVSLRASRMAVAAGGEEVFGEVAVTGDADSDLLERP